MKKDYDIIIVGAGCAGAYFARRMAERGFSVLIIDKSKRECISTDYDIFHFTRNEMEQFGLPMVNEGDDIFCFEYDTVSFLSPYGNYAKSGNTDATIGMHKCGYIQLMNDWAIEAGAEIIYEAEFLELIYKSGKISGVKFKKNDEIIECSCRLCADCSGKKAVVRRSLPDSYGIEKFELTQKDVFFVKLRYIKFDEPVKKWLTSHNWMFYKAWLSPTDDSADAILGMGSCVSYKIGDEIFETLMKNLKLPSFKTVKTECGTTPYHRAIYSFVSDGFIAMGDAASLTRPNNGEGCAANLVLSDVAVDIIGEVMKNGEYPTREKIWGVNKEYNKKQGAVFAFMLSALAKAMQHSIGADEYMYKHDIFFTQPILCGNGKSLSVSPAEIFNMIRYILAGMATKELPAKELGEMLGGALKGVKVGLHYALYPKTPDKFDKWVKRADKLWKKAGQMSDFFADR